MSLLSSFGKSALATAAVITVSSSALAGTISAYGGSNCPEMKILKGSDTIAGFKLKPARMPSGSYFAFLGANIRDFIYNSNVTAQVGKEFVLFGERNGQATSWSTRVLSPEAGKSTGMVVPEMEAFMAFRVIGLDRNTPNRDLPIKARIIENNSPAKMSEYLEIELTNTQTGDVTLVGYGCSAGL